MWKGFSGYKSLTNQYSAQFSVPAYEKLTTEFRAEVSS